MSELHARWLGLVPYREAEALQYFQDNLKVLRELGAEVGEQEQGRQAYGSRAGVDQVVGSS